MIVTNNISMADEHSLDTFDRAWPGRRHSRYLHRYCPTAKDLNVSLRATFVEASQEIPTIVSRASVLGGAPCVRGTRIPVFMILDAIEYYGSVKGVLKSYPTLTREQVRDAVRYAKLVM